MFIETRLIASLSKDEDKLLTFPCKKAEMKKFSCLCVLIRKAKMLKIEETENLSDEELAKLTLENQDNFLYIIERYKLKLFNYVRRISDVCDEDAEDILQEVFLKVYLNMNDFDQDLKFSTWIYSIARNHTISSHRKRRARAEGYAIPIDDETVKNIMIELDAPKAIDEYFLQSNVQKILDKLESKYSEVLVLKFIEEKNYQEISDIIKKPMGTVASMINRAKKEFKKQLNGNVEMNH